MAKTVTVYKMRLKLYIKKLENLKKVKSYEASVKFLKRSGSQMQVLLSKQTILLLPSLVSIAANWDMRYSKWTVSSLILNIKFQTVCNIDINMTINDKVKPSSNYVKNQLVVVS